MLRHLIFTLSLISSPKLSIRQNGSFSCSCGTLLQQEVQVEDIILLITKVLREGTHDGKTHVAAAIACLLQSQHVDDTPCKSIHRARAVLALVALLVATNL